MVRWFKARGADATTKARFHPSGTAAGVRQSCCCGCAITDVRHDTFGRVSATFFQINEGVCTDCNTEGSPSVKWSSLSINATKELLDFDSSTAGVSTFVTITPSNLSNLRNAVSEDEGCNETIDTAVDLLVQVQIRESDNKILSVTGTGMNGLMATVFDSGSGVWSLGEKIPNANPACGSAALIAATGGYVVICPELDKPVCVVNRHSSAENECCFSRDSSIRITVYFSSSTVVEELDFAGNQVCVGSSSSLEASWYGDNYCVSSRSGRNWVVRDLQFQSVTWLVGYPGEGWLPSDDPNCCGVDSTVEDPPFLDSLYVDSPTRVIIEVLNNRCCRNDSIWNGGGTAGNKCNEGDVDCSTSKCYE